MPDQKPIKCSGCDTLFGIEIDGYLNIKHRDLFRRIDGTVTGPCRRCGHQVIWSNNDNSGFGSTGLANFSNTDH